MHDPVADILAERRTLDSATAPAVLFSILVHGSLVAGAVYAALHHAPPRAATTLNIRFAKSAAPVTEMKPAAPAAKKPAVPKIQEPKPQPLKPVEKPAEPPKKNTVPFSPFGQSAKKGSENVEKAPAPPPPTTNNQPLTTGVVGVGETGITGIEGGDFPYTIYLERMKTLVGTRWVRPQAASGQPAIIYFVIERDGRVRDAKIETRSGNTGFDRAALRAVIEASPLPPLPFGYNGTYLGVHLTFR